MKEVDENYEAYMADGGAENLAKQREEEAAEKKLTLKEQIARAMVQVNCEICYLHKPGTYTRKDCITYGKRLCALEEVHVDKILALGLVQLDEDQSLPESRHQLGLQGCNSGCHIVEQENMLKSNWRKVKHA